mmetsp:Transcript_62176/g.182292  ORF Transcript_62176/g.182292 Transcript_62176/m.182292 type:complete len:249 (-) Transcript_62176:96-842(-)
MIGLRDQILPVLWEPVAHEPEDGLNEDVRHAAYHPVLDGAVPAVEEGVGLEHPGDGGPALSEDHPESTRDLVVDPIRVDASHDQPEESPAALLRRVVLDDRVEQLHPLGPHPGQLLEERGLQIAHRVLALGLLLGSPVSHALAVHDGIADGARRAAVDRRLRGLHPGPRRLGSLVALSALHPYGHLLEVARDGRVRLDGQLAVGPDVDIQHASDASRPRRFLVPHGCRKTSPPLPRAPNGSGGGARRV